MRFSLWALATILIPFAQGVDHQVHVGDQNGQKVFSPTTVNADVNDTVVFIFLSNHTVTQTVFSQPCLKSAMSSFDSGFLAAGRNYTVPVASADTIWIRCSGHCALGMVFAVNAPNSGETFQKFQANALGANGSSTETSSASSTAPPSSSHPTSSSYSTSSSSSTTTTTSRGAAPPRFVVCSPVTLVSGIIALVLGALAL